MEPQATTVDGATTLVESLRLDVARMEQISTSQNFSGPLKIFTRFSELPTELKVIIWKFTFPARRLIQFSVPLRVMQSCTYQVDPPLPIALHVCRLSRETILEDYRIVYEHHLPYYERYDSVGGRPSHSLFPVPRHRPICFNHKVDQFCIDASELHEFRNNTELQKVVTEFPGCLDDIQVLEVRNVVWILRSETQMQNLSGGTNQMRKYERFDYGALSHFRNLKELHLISSKNQDPCGSRQGLLVTRKAHVDFMNWYRAARELDPEYLQRSIPHVSFHCNRKKRVMSDEQRRHWNKLTVTESENGDLVH